MKCWATDVTFVRPTPIKLNLRFERNANDLKTDFFVTNDDAVAVKNIRFNCITDQGETMKVVAYPSYLTDARKETVIGPGQTAKFTSKEWVWKFSSCNVSNTLVAD